MMPVLPKYLHSSDITDLMRDTSTLIPECINAMKNGKPTSFLENGWITACAHVAIFMAQQSFSTSRPTNIHHAA